VLESLLTFRSALDRSLRTRPAHAGVPVPNTSPNAMLRGRRLPNQRCSQSALSSARGLSGEVGLEFRSVANLSALAVASVSGPLAASAGRAGGLVVLGLSAAAGAVAGRTLV